MKDFRFKTLIILIIFLPIFVIGCKKDDKVGNEFSYNNKSYTLTYGAIDDWGQSSHIPATYVFELMLASKGITYNSSEGDYIGTGSFIELYLYSRNQNDLDPGTYAFDGFASEDSLTFDAGRVGINFNLITGEPDTAYYEVETGVVDVAKRGNVYELDFSVYIDGGKEVKGYYLGALDKHVVNKKKKINKKD